MSYDATASVAMEKGSYVKLSTAAMPVPTLNSLPLDGDWFQSIRDKLHWNVRTLQKPLKVALAASEMYNSDCSATTFNIQPQPQPQPEPVHDAEHDSSDSDTETLTKRPQAL